MEGTIKRRRRSLQNANLVKALPFPPCFARSATSSPTLLPPLPVRMLINRDGCADCGCSNDAPPNVIGDNQEILCCPNCLFISSQSQ